MQLAYAHINLRRNPFGEPPDDEAASLLLCSEEEELVARLQRALTAPKDRCIIQFMGQCGRGKSAHMRALHAHFPLAPWLYFGAHTPHPKLPPLASTPLIFLDETQRLSWWRRQRLWRSDATLVIATHRDHRHELSARRAHIIHRHIGGLDRAQLRHICERRITWALRDPAQPCGARLHDALLDALLVRHGDDLRAMLYTLYELVQSMSAPGDIPLPSQFDLSHIEPSQHLLLNQERTTFTTAYKDRS